jgi:predicted AAA+ superfamily ATPase
MNSKTKKEIRTYLRNSMSQAEFRAKAFVFNDDEKLNPKRHMFIKLNKYVNDFLSGKTSKRWITMYGLRGAGKTTLLWQLFYNLENRFAKKLFLSLNELINDVGVSLKDVILVYEEMMGNSLEEQKEPLFLFLDEVHYDKTWPKTLRQIYERSKKVFILATGSSTLGLVSEADVTRRTIFEKLFPMSFSEYMMIKNKNFGITNLSSKVRAAIFNSPSPTETYKKLIEVKHEVEMYWASVTRFEEDNYINIGTLPFMIGLENEAIVYDQLRRTLEEVVKADIQSYGEFSSDVISKIPAILYMIADSDQLSINSLARDLKDISRPTLIEVLDILEKTETLTRIYPYGSHFAQVRKPSKYLFSSPAFRSMYFNYIGSTISRENYKGKLLEDLVAMYLKRYLETSRAGKSSLCYDSSKGGADFVVTLNEKKVVLEVGYGNKDFKQIVKTLKKINSNFGICISENEIKIDAVQGVVNIPLKYFLLT